MKSRVRWIAGPAASVAIALLPPILPRDPPPSDPPPSDPPSGPTAKMPAFGVRVATTGNDSERVRTLPIGSRTGGRDRVVMSLGPSKLPRLRDGDRVRVSAEVQVSTTCVVERHSRCIGRRYAFSPRVLARIVLADGPRQVEGRGAKPISTTKSVRCAQPRPDRNHHCMIVFAGADTRVRNEERLPCAPNACYINLAMRAVHPGAERGNLLVVGDDEYGGRVGQDKGRLNAVIVRRNADADVDRIQSREVISRRLPLYKDGVGARRAVYSVRVPRPQRGDLLAVTAREVVGLAGSRNAYIGSELILSDHRLASTPGDLAKRSAPMDARLSEFNGFNCTRGLSAFQTPCRTAKVGVIHIRRDVVDAAGQPRPLYVNLVSKAVPIVPSRARRGDRVMVRDRGVLRVVRYSPR